METISHGCADARAVSPVRGGFFNFRLFRKESLTAVGKFGWQTPVSSRQRLIDHGGGIGSGAVTVPNSVKVITPFSYF